MEVPVQDLFREHLKWALGLDVSAKTQNPGLPIRRKSPAKIIRLTEYTCEKWE
jgi:hypothetical protein